jgi:2-polyprenyl-3-methyl-5-hydroxy-6-metoxy-1,4-benzoquinol methylase
MKNKCPICGSKNILKFLERNNVPVHQNYLAKKRNEAIDITNGNIELYLCNDCGFIFNATFDNRKLNYGPNYDNTQDISDVFKEYIEHEINYLIENYDINNKTVIEIGCGKGAFLTKLVENSGCNAIGFDPSYIGEEVIYNGKLKFIKDFYSKQYNNLKADFIICRHVIEHLEYPIEMLNEINQAIGNSQDALLFIETPSVNWILENNIIYDFFYEHCSYFEDVSIIKALNLCGFKVEKFVRKFSNQYMWIIAKKSNEINQVDNNTINRLKNSSINYKNNLSNDIDKINRNLKKLSSKGKIAVWGAGAKGSTFVNLVDCDNKIIDSIIDINKNKQGCFIVGTGHEIIDYLEIMKRNIKTIIVMNNNYYKEIEKILMKNNIDVRLVSGEDLI